jgi:hypothetical protein
MQYRFITHITISGLFFAEGFIDEAFSTIDANYFIAGVPFIP